MKNLITIRCTSCGTLNRVPADKAGMTGKCGSCGERIQAPAGPAGALLVGDSDFDSVVMSSKLPVLVEFWAPGCGHCVRMDPVVEDIAGELTGRATVAKVDVSSSPKTASFFEIRGTPSFVVIKDGREATRFIGAMLKDELNTKIRPFV